MSLPYPEHTAIIFAAEQRVFLTPELPVQCLGEHYLINAIKVSYEICQENLLTPSRSLCDALTHANPEATEFICETLESPIDPGQVAFLTYADRVLVVNEAASGNMKTTSLTTYSRFLGASFFMEAQGPMPLLSGFHRTLKEEHTPIHEVILPDGRYALVHQDDLEELLGIAQQHCEGLSDASAQRDRTLRMCRQLERTIGGDAPTANTVIQGPWGR